jgi:O-antigen/teichoic acid export membrane protein
MGNKGRGVSPVSTASLPGIPARVRAASFVSDFSSTFASRLASKVIMAFVVALAARRLGPQIFGAYVAIVTYAGMAAALVDFGLAPYVTRTISEGAPARQPLLIAAAIRTAICVALVICAAIPAIVYQIASFRSLPVVYVAASMFIDLLTDLLLAALRGFGRFNDIARTTVVRSAASLVATSAFVFFQSSLSFLTFAFLVSSAAGLAYTTWQSRDFLAHLAAGVVRDRLMTCREGMRSALGATWAFGVSAILGSAYIRLGSAVLARTSGVELGIYGSAYKVIEAGLFAASIVCSILVPYLSATRAASQEQHRRMVEASMRLMLIPSFLLANLLIVVADPLIALLYGPKFSEAGTVLEVLSLFLLLGAVTGGAQSAILISMGEMKWVSWLMGGALVLCLPLNLLLTPRYGAVGAAAASCIGEAFVLVANLVLFKRRGLESQERLIVLCIVLTVTGIIAQHLPAPAPVMAPIAYAAVFGWKCLRDLRWSVAALSHGRQMTVRPQCG